MRQFNPSYRAAAIGVGAAALLVGAFVIGLSQGGGSSAQAATTTGQQRDAQSAAGRITVTGTGTVTGTPDQLVLSRSSASRRVPARPWSIPWRPRAPVPPRCPSHQVASR
jgi:hypothetical protein